MYKASIVSIRTQSPTYKLIEMATQQNKTTPTKNKTVLPGQVCDIHIWAYGTLTLPITPSTQNKDAFEFYVSNETIPGNALHHMRIKDDIEISQPKGKEFPCKEFLQHTMLCIIDNTGISALLSLIPYCMQHKKEFKKIVILYNVPEQSEILAKEKLKEIEKQFRLIIQTGTPKPIKQVETEINPLITKVSLCVAPEKQESMIRAYVKPLGISYKNTFMWNNGNTKTLL